MTRGKSLLIGTGVLLALFAALAAMAGLSSATGPTGEREPLPASSGAAADISGSPYLQLPQEFRDLPPAQPPASRRTTTDTVSPGIMSYDPATGATRASDSSATAPVDAATPPFTGLLPGVAPR